MGRRNSSRCFEISSWTLLNSFLYNLVNQPSFSSKYTCTRSCILDITFNSIISLLAIPYSFSHCTNSDFFKFFKETHSLWICSHARHSGEDKHLTCFVPKTIFPLSTFCFSFSSSNFFFLFPLSRTISASSSSLFCSFCFCCLT